GASTAARSTDHPGLDAAPGSLYEVGVRRGVVAVVAVAGLLACAPAWGGTVAHSQLELPLGSLALPSPPERIREAGLTSAAASARPTAHLSITPGTLSYHGGRVKFAIS